MGRRLFWSWPDGQEVRWVDTYSVIDAKILGGLVQVTGHEFQSLLLDPPAVEERFAGP